MKAGIASSISLATLLILTIEGSIACGRDQNLFGHWEGARDWRKIGATNELVAKGLAAVDLDLKSDGSFRLTDFSLTFEGSWSQTSTGVDLRVETVMGRPLELQPEATKKQVQYLVRYSSDRLYFKSPMDPAEIELKKKAEPKPN